MRRRAAPLRAGSVAVRGLRRHAGPAGRAGGRLRPRRGAPPPAGRVDRLRPRHRPGRRVPQARLDGLLRRRAAAGRAPDRPPALPSPPRSASRCSSPPATRSAARPRCRALPRRAGRAGLRRWPPRWPGGSCPSRGRPRRRSWSGCRRPPSPTRRRSTRRCRRRRRSPRAVLLALRVRERPRVRWAAAGRGAASPCCRGSGRKYLPVAAVVAERLVAGCSSAVGGARRAGRRRGRVRLAGDLRELQRRRVLRRLTPYAARSDGATAPERRRPATTRGRVDRLVGAVARSRVGLLRWAPFLALAFLGAWLLWRSRRERVARAVPEQADARRRGRAAAARPCCAQVLTAAFLAPFLAGPWFPGARPSRRSRCAAALAAWGLRHAPRVGTVLAAITLAGERVAVPGAAPGRRPAGPPRRRRAVGPCSNRSCLRSGTPYADVVALAALAALAALGGREWLRRRRARAAALPRPVG